MRLPLASPALEREQGRRADAGRCCRAAGGLLALHCACDGVLSHESQARPRITSGSASVVERLLGWRPRVRWPGLGMKAFTPPTTAPTTNAPSFASPAPIRRAAAHAQHEAGHQVVRRVAPFVRPLGRPSAPRLARRQLGQAAKRLQQLGCAERGAMASGVAWLLPSSPDPAGHPSPGCTQCTLYPALHAVPQPARAHPHGRKRPARPAHSTLGASTPPAAPWPPHGAHPRRPSGRPSGPSGRLPPPPPGPSQRPFSHDSQAGDAHGDHTRSLAGRWRRRRCVTHSASDFILKNQRSITEGFWPFPNPSLPF